MNSDLFLRDKPPKVLIYLSNKKYHPKTHVEIDCTYYHLTKVLKMFKNTELITMEKKGRKKVVKLTEKGKFVADNLKKIKRMVDGK